jgi:serine protease Do
MSNRYYRARFGAAVVVAFICGLVFASGFDLTHFGWAQSRVNAPSKPAPAQIASATETQSAFEAVADAARPAVVSIETERFAKTTNTSRRFGNPQGGRRQPSIEDLLRGFDQRPNDLPEEASGSGFIVSNDGYILTNNHVVADADRVTVTLFDKRQYDAKVVGRDSTTDVAVVKIDEKNLPMLGFGDDSKLRVGQWVLAIGNPLRLNFTVTAGIVSAKGRTSPELLNPRNTNPYAITDYIQTDAAINPGNSGGPLLNIRGDVVGINSAIASGTGYYAGYGFAIPITLAKQVMDDLIKFGKVKRAVVGVQLNEVNSADARAAGLSQVGGAKVVDFSPKEGSPAEKAGLEIGDVIVAAAGQPIDQVSTLQRVIRGNKPGEVVELDVMRFGQKKNFKIKLGEPTDAPATLAELDEDGARGGPARNEISSRQADKLGISVSPVTAQIASELKLSGAARNGLLITNVSPRGPAFRAPLGEGEVILSELFPTKRDIKTTEDLMAALAPLKPNDVIELKVCAPIPGGACQMRAVSIQIPR